MTKEEVNPTEDVKPAEPEAKATKPSAEKKLVELDIDNPKHANLTFDELQKLSK